MDSGDSSPKIRKTPQEYHGYDSEEESPSQRQGIGGTARQDADINPPSPPVHNVSKRQVTFEIESLTDATRSRSVSPALPRVGKKGRVEFSSEGHDTNGVSDLEKLNLYDQDRMHQISAIEKEELFLRRGGRPGMAPERVAPPFSRSPSQTSPSSRGRSVHRSPTSTYSSLMPPLPHADPALVQHEHDRRKDSSSRFGYTDHEQSPVSRARAYDNPKPPLVRGNGDFDDPEFAPTSEQDISSESELEDLDLDETSNDPQLPISGRNSPPRNSKEHFDDGGDVTSINLVCGVGDGSENQRSTHSVFHWTHMQAQAMEFEEFMHNVLQTPDLPIADKRVIKQRMGKFRRGAEQFQWVQDDTRVLTLTPDDMPYRKIAASPANCHMDQKYLHTVFPYLSLGEHNTRITTRSASTYYTPTLLQHSSFSTSPQRDSQQIAGSHPVRLSGQCCYVEQLWGLLLGDERLFTYASLDEHSLRGADVSLTRQPTYGVPHVRVSDGGNCVWQISLDDCQTWFGFAAHFMEISTTASRVPKRFDELFRVFHRGKTIVAKDWDGILQEAKNASILLVLWRRARPERARIVHNDDEDDIETATDSEQTLWTEADDKNHPFRRFSSEGDSPKAHLHMDSTGPMSSNETQATGSSTPDLDADREPVRRTTKEPTQTSATAEPEVATLRNEAPTFMSAKEGRFHALLWFLEGIDPAAPSAQQPDANSSQMISSVQQTLDRIHHYLLHDTPGRARKAYQHCSQKELTKVARFLLAVTRDTEQPGGYLRGLSTLETFFIATVQVFELFIPLRDSSISAQKYWGAVYFIMRHILVAGKASRSHLDSIERFKQVAHLATVIQDELSGVQGPQLRSVALPTEFRKAWIHCVLHLSLFRYKWADRDRQQHLDKVETLLNRGRQLLRWTIMREPLQRKEVASPMSLLCLFIRQILANTAQDAGQIRIVHMYMQYWRYLETEVKSGRAERGQPQISYLQQEIGAILDIICIQLKRLDRMYDHVKKLRNGCSLPYSKKGETKRELSLLQECIIQIQKQKQMLESINTQSTELEKWVNEQTVLTKDRQDKAIYAFTIVTLVFLPLSFVCSFLGMNTADIRGMDSGQWVFWVAALPLTFVVMLIALLWTAELRYFWHMLLKLLGIPHDEQHYSVRHEFKHRKPWSSRSWKSKNVFKGKVTAKKSQQPVPLNPPPLLPESTPEMWDKPYRRTQTFKSIVE